VSEGGREEGIKCVRKGVSKSVRNSGAARESAEGVSARAVLPRSEGCGLYASSVPFPH